MLKLNEQISSSIDWSAWSKIVIDAGAGVGLFSCQYAKNNPDTLVIAIERTHLRSAKLIRRAQNHELANLFVAQADVMVWIKEHVPNQVVCQIYFFYPNPWPKKKHKKRRYLFHPLWPEVERILIPGAQLSMSSNISAYIEEAEEYLAKSSSFDSIRKVVLDSKIQARTHFERKYLQRGQACWELQAEKINPQKA